MLSTGGHRVFARDIPGPPGAPTILILHGFPTSSWDFADATAYVADVSEPADRAKNFGLLSAALGLGFILGPVFGGLLGELGARVPFWAAAGLSGLNLLYGLFILPESLPAASRRAFDLRRANPVGALLQVRRYPMVLGLLVVLVPYQLAHHANPAVWGYYTMSKFGWSTSTVGWSLSFVGVTMMIVNAGLVGPVIDRIGEARAVLLGFAAMAAGFLVFAFATEGWMMFAGIVPFALIGIAQPALRGMMANRVPADAQGELQGATSSVMSLTMIVSPVLMTELFHAFSSVDAPVRFPGAPFLAAAILALGALALFARAIRPRPRRA